MSKEQLLKELMRKDIENARLKKGYAVRGGGTEKEFVSLSGKNTK
jgi:transposase